jgi:hypothetical protein
MKIKKYVIGFLLIFFSLNLFSQSDSLDFFNLKLVSDKVQIFEKRDDKPTKLRNMGLPDTYFFFTKEGIYGADEFGILIYEFKSDLVKIESHNINKYYILAKDTQAKLDCEVVVYDYLDKDRYKLFFIYDKKEFIFDCDEVE